MRSYIWLSERYSLPHSSPLMKTFHSSWKFRHCKCLGFVTCRVWLVEVNNFSLSRCASILPMRSHLTDRRTRTATSSWWLWDIIISRSLGIAPDFRRSCSSFSLYFTRSARLLSEKTFASTDRVHKSQSQPAIHVQLLESPNKKDVWTSNIWKGCLVVGSIAT